MKLLSMAVIGAWGHSVDVLAQTERMPGIRIAAMARVFPDDDFGPWCQRFAKAAESRTYSDYRDLLQHEPPDIVVIGTRLDRISEIAVDAARAGCHLICEKPLASNLDRLQALREEVEMRGVACISMLANEDQPAFRAAAESVRRGDIGSVAQAHVRKTYKWGVRPTWFGDPDIYPGTIPWVGIHAFDILSYITRLSPIRIAAQHGNAAHPSHPGCQDRAELLLELPGDAGASISVDYLRPETAVTHGDDYVRVSGSRGQIEAFADRGDGGICELTDRNGIRLVPLPPRGHVYQDFIRDIADAKHTELKERTQAAFNRTIWCLRAHQAAVTRRIQVVPPPDR